MWVGKMFLDFTQPGPKPRLRKELGLNKRRTPRDLQCWGIRIVGTGLCFSSYAIVVPVRSNDLHFIISIRDTQERNLSSLFYNLAKLDASLEKKAKWLA